MILRPQARDLQIIGFYLGKIIIGVGAFMILPMLVAVCGEINPFFDFLIGFYCALPLVYFTYFCYIRQE